MIRSRRAGLSRDEARQQPLYARMLGLQYLAPGGFLCFVFLEGAVALGVLLALAELVSWWGVLVLPAMVAAMVKLNDVVAGSLVRHTAAGSLVHHTAAGSLLRPAAAGQALPPAAAGVRPSPPGSSGAATVRLSAARIAQVSARRPAGGSPALRPASGSPTLRPAALRRAPGDMMPGDMISGDPVPGARDEERWLPSAMDASALNGPPVTRQWTEDLDDSQQRARQSAARRYE